MGYQPKTIERQLNRTKDVWCSSNLPHSIRKLNHWDVFCIGKVLVLILNVGSWFLPRTGDTKNLTTTILHLLLSIESGHHLIPGFYKVPTKFLKFTHNSWFSQEFLATLDCQNVTHYTNKQLKRLGHKMNKINTEGPPP